MLPSTLFVRRSLFVVLPAVALIAVGCDDDDAPGPSSGADAGADSNDAGTAGAFAGHSSAGAADNAGNAGTGATNAGGAAGTSTGGALGIAGSPDGGASAADGPAPVLLGSASGYAVLAKSAISNVPTSAITGNLGLSPAAASFVTGFSLVKAGTHWTSPQVVGGVFAADNDPPTPINLTTAIADMLIAYTDAASRPTPDFLNLGAGTIGGLTLEPGLYKWASSVTIPTDITLEGDENSVWIFQVTGDLKLSAAKAMTLSGGAQAKNIFWQVAGLVDFGTTSHSEGIVLSKTAIKLGTGATINGRLLAQTAVNLSSSTVTEPAH